MFVRGYHWPPDLQDLENLIVTHDGEFFSPSPTSEIGNAENIFQLRKQHKEIGEFGYKCALEDPVACDIMSRNIQYVEGRHQLPLLWRNVAASLTDSRKTTLLRLESLQRSLLKDPRLHQRYAEQMENTVLKGYAEQIPDTHLSCGLREWYNAHNPVLKAQKQIRFELFVTALPLSLNDFLIKGLLSGTLFGGRN